MIQTLANLYPEAQQQLKKLGYPNIARMMFYFTRQAAMDAALGYGPGACSNWFRMKASPSLVSETRAREWLEKHHPEKPEEEPAPENIHFLQKERVVEKPVSTPDSKPDPEKKGELLLMVSGRPDRLRKLIQVAEFMELKVITLSDDSSGDQ